MQRTIPLRNILLTLVLLTLPTLACDLSSLVSLAKSATPTPVATIAPPTTAPTTAPVTANIITNAVTAKDAKGDNFDPSGITDAFPSNQNVFHAVVTISGAPANTRVKATWLTSKNSTMGEYELATEGSRNLDFTFAPDGGKLPAGDYSVELYVNGKLDRTLKFTVQAGTASSSSSSGSSRSSTAASAVPKPSGLVNSVTLAEGVQGDAKDPVNPTVVFKPSAIFHAVVRTQNAPPNTKFKASWYVVDVGNVAPAGSLIDETDLTTDGSRNIDFTLAPNNNWPVGSYRVEIYVNGVLDTIRTFNVK